MTDNPIKLYFKIVPLGALLNIISHIRIIYLLHLITYFNGTQIATIYGIMLPLLDLIGAAVPDAYS